MPVNRRVSDPPCMAGKKDLPPPLPEDVLARVLRLARTDGRMLLIISGAFAVVSAMGQQGLGAVAGCLAAGAGALELHGASLLRQGDARGMGWLVRSQLALMVVIIGYVIARMMTFDPELMRSLITPEMRDQLATVGVPEDQIIPRVKHVYQFMYTVVAVVTVAYQGGMAIYYLRRKAVVEQALTQE